MFIRGVLEGENATCVTSESCLKGVLATIPDLVHVLARTRGRDE